MTSQAFSGRWDPVSRAQSVWHELPFEVDAHARGVRVTLDYDRTHGSSGVLDLGLVDPLGWRGWSGGARSVIDIGPQSSTPGYVDRGLPVGEWQVVLGLHRLPEEGLEWRVVIEREQRTPVVSQHLSPTPREARRPRRDLPALEGLTWRAGDCHAHSVHSDGVLTLDELADGAVRSGLDYLWVTDHNTVSHHALLPDVSSRHGVALLAGQEVTTADGHANAFGDIGWIDFRRPAQRWLDDVNDRGGLLSINHPVSGDCAWRHQLTGHASLAEVWHETWTPRDDAGPLAWWVAHGRATPLGGSDFHAPSGRAALGSPTTWVACADDDVLAAMAAGRTSISADRDAPVLLHVGDEWVAVDAEGCQLVCPDGRRTPVTRPLHRLTGHDGSHLLERTDRSIVSIAS